MKTYKFTIDVYVYGDNADAAAAHLIGELDYVMELDNNMQAYTHPTQGIEQVEANKS